jgi:hypothetical protein
MIGSSANPHSETVFPIHQYATVWSTNTKSNGHHGATTLPPSSTATSGSWEAEQGSSQSSPSQNPLAESLAIVLRLVLPSPSPHSPLPDPSLYHLFPLPLLQDIYRERFGINFDQWFTNEREVSVLKSDVWRSIDGVTWELVTPGCRAPQNALIAFGNKAEKGKGTLEARCETDADCYSPAESCQLVDGNLTCVCQMWGPREQHTVSVFGGFMYVIGGYGSALFSEMSNCGAYACGDTNAGSYRFYHNVSPLPSLFPCPFSVSCPLPSPLICSSCSPLLSLPQDIWRSRDGEIWESVNPGTGSTFSPGRGGHQVVVLPRKQDSSKATFLLFGGSTGTPLTNEVTHLNDIWYANSENPGVWTKLNLPVPWSPRYLPSLILSPALPLLALTLILSPSFLSPSGQGIR